VTSERTGQPVVRLTLETAQVFATFAYDLSVDEERAPGSLTLIVRGLRAPHLGMPRPGPAQWSHDYEDLAGPWTVTVRGLDGETHRCTLHVDGSTLRLAGSHGPDPAFSVAVTQHHSGT
jgi:hypothetical protein